MEMDLKERVGLLLDELAGEVKGKILVDHPLSRLTTFQIGGPAAVVFIPESEEEVELASRLCGCHGLPLKVMGRGSNVLASDSGFPGMVMLIVKRGFKDIHENKCIVEVDAGISMNRLVRWCVEKGLGGLEGLAGIPGTVGGAVHNNAGARAAEIGECLLEARIFDGRGWSWIERGRMPIGYRHSGIEGIIYKVKLELKRERREKLETRFEENLLWRKRSQPLSRHSAGCVFKNKEGHFAGELVERCGCKGWRVGDAVVSEKHANFIVNTGRAKAWQVWELMEAVRRKVLKETGIELEREVELLGEFPSAEDMQQTTFDRLG